MTTEGQEKHVQANDVLISSESNKLQTSYHTRMRHIEVQTKQPK